MRIATWMGIALLVGAGAWCLGGSTARAEDPVEAQPPGTWRLDARVVRVIVSAKQVETPALLPGTNEAGLSTSPWRELLAALQARGTTQVLMDRSATTVSNMPAKLSQSQTWNVLVVERSDLSNVQRTARPFRTGADLQLVCTDGPQGALLDYHIAVDWLAPGEADAPRLEQATWKGAQVQHGPGTLVLRHAQQDDDKAGTEIYVLISWRR